jgi:hypothetical protein
MEMAATEQVLFSVVVAAAAGCALWRARRHDRRSGLWKLNEPAATAAVLRATAFVRRLDRAATAAVEAPAWSSADGPDGLGAAARAALGLPAVAAALAANDAAAVAAEALAVVVANETLYDFVRDKDALLLVAGDAPLLHLPRAGSDVDVVMRVDVRVLHKAVRRARRDEL